MANARVQLSSTDFNFSFLERNGLCITLWMGQINQNLAFLGQSKGHNLICTEEK